MGKVKEESMDQAQRSKEKKVSKVQTWSLKEFNKTWSAA